MLNFLWVSLLIGANPHSLDDLSGAEIKKAISVIKQSKKFDAEVRFPIVTLAEPDKYSVIAGKPTTREAFVLAYQTKQNKTSEVVVDLKANKISSIKELSGVQPPILIEEFDRLSSIVKADPQWQAAMKKRGLKLEDVWVDGWAPGLLSTEEKSSGARYMRGLSYLKANKDNYYARPIEGVVVTVDMNQSKVTEVLDTGVVPVAEGWQEFYSKKTSANGRKLKPLIPTQPQGHSFQINGQQIKWDRWSFRYSMHPMHGLQIYDVKFKDGAKDRSILYKISLSEMVVPYADPEREWSFRNAFDVGEYGIGKTAHPLTLGGDLPQNSAVIDTVYANDAGEPVISQKAIGVYERDGGVLWNHRDQFTGITAARRATQLVVTFTTTIGNYDYGINYVFHQDAVVEVEVFLTGIMLAKGTKETTNPCDNDCGHLVEANIKAPLHQHFFNFRMDLDVDGSSNTPYEVDVKAVKPGKENPDFNVFNTIQNALLTEKAAARDLSLALSRKWKVTNPQVKNKFQHPVGYMLMTGGNSLPYITPESPIRKRAGFVDHQVWFTKYKSNEQGAASDYPNQSNAGEGLPSFISDDESLKSEDVVLWYTFGLTHVTRPEEWPVMNVHKMGFQLIPMNFFEKNPALDVQ